MEKCIFCEIVNKKIPAMTVYEDDRFVAFLDISPLNPGHTLIIPKDHVRWSFEVEDFGDYCEVAKSVANAAISELEAFTVNILTIGFGEGMVPHAHIHIVPRFENDGLPSLPILDNRKEIPKEEMEKIAAKIKAGIEKNPPKKGSVPISEKPEEPKEEARETLSEEDVAYMRSMSESG